MPLSEEMDMNQNNGIHALVAQWITSLAISVVCCAVLFVVFAGYIMDLKSTSSLATARLEYLSEKHSHLASEVALLKRSIPPQPLPQAAVPAEPIQATLPEVSPPEMPPSTGVEISDPAPLEPNESGDMTPVMLPSAKAPVQTKDPAASTSVPETKTKKQ